MKDTAADAGKHVADTAKGQAQNVVEETKSQASGLLEQVKGEANDQVGSQQQRWPASWAPIPRARFDGLEE